MNILFLTLLDFNSIEEHNIYTDLLREFMSNGHNLYVVSPIERRRKQSSYLINDKNVVILKQKIGNIQKTNLLEKGFSTLFIESHYIYGIRKNFAAVKFDLVIYSTPPITFCKAIEYVKNRDHAKTYLLLKDIFPQNAVDIGMLSKTGVKGIIYKYFRDKEKKLYSISDRIGCMSQANVEYVTRNNTYLDGKKVEVCPNSIEIVDKSTDEDTKITIRKKYGIPLDKTIFLYGGNLGKPQGIPFLIECLKSQKDNIDAYFLVVGDGTEFSKLQAYINEFHPANFKLMKRLPKQDFDVMVGACDVGMIFLDHRFTIPNFPSRLLSYMQAKIPVLAVTDPNTDIGKVIVDGGFGWWCESNNADDVSKTMDTCLRSKKLDEMGQKAYLALDRYKVQSAYKIIISAFD